MATMRTKVAQVLQHASEQVRSLEQALRLLSVSSSSMHWCCVCSTAWVYMLHAATLTCHLHRTMFHCLHQLHTSALSNPG